MYIRNSAMRSYTHECMHVDMHACIHAYMHTQTHIHAFLHICIHAYTHTYSTCKYAHMHAYKHPPMYIVYSMHHMSPRRTQCVQKTKRCSRMHGKKMKKNVVCYIYICKGLLTLSQKRIRTHFARKRTCNMLIRSKLPAQAQAHQIPSRTRTHTHKQDLKPHTHTHTHTHMRCKATWCIRRSTRCEPTNPAPPVTKMRSFLDAGSCCTVGYTFCPSRCRPCTCVCVRIDKLSFKLPT
jgi:hypothetical protein